MRQLTSFFIKYSLVVCAIVPMIVAAAHAAKPLWIFTPLTATTVAVPTNSTALIQYTVTNQSSRRHTLVVQPIVGVTQLIVGPGVCGNPFVLPADGSCTLTLQVNGSQLRGRINGGPVVCQQDPSSQCYRPGRADILRITPAAPITDASISVSGSPLALTVNGMSGQLIVTNDSTEVAATNISSNFTGTALDGNVTETGNTCSSVAPGANCTLTYTPGTSVVPQTDFPIQGSNTNAVTAAISIQSGSTLTLVSPNSGTTGGQTGVTLTGTGLTGATSVTFGGVAATSVNVVNSTTVTAVTPAHAVGVVDIAIDTPAGGASLANGYTYLTPAVGQSARGGVIACLNGGQNNLIAAVADNSAGILWGGQGTAIGAGAQSDTNGASNTTAIVLTLRENGGTPYAAQVCDQYAVDSQGNAPCQAGNTCYNNWFLPAKDQLDCLYVNNVAIGGFAASTYWTSTEDSTSATLGAWAELFSSGIQNPFLKNSLFRVRCVQAFAP